MRRRNLWGVVGEWVSGEKGWVSLKGEVGSLPEGGWWAFHHPTYHEVFGRGCSMALTSPNLVPRGTM